MSTVVDDAIGSAHTQTGLFIREPIADQTLVSSDDDDQTWLARTFPTQSTLTISGTPMVGESSNGMTVDLRQIYISIIYDPCEC